MTDNDLKLLSNGTKNMFREFIDKNTFKNQLANMLTFIRLIIPTFAVGLSIKGIKDDNKKHFYSSGILTLVGALTDLCDGMIARKYNSTSEYGKLLDQITDKIFSFTLTTNLSFINPKYLSLLIEELSTSILNLYYKTQYDIDIPSTTIGKIKQWPLFITIATGYISYNNDKLNDLSNRLLLISNSLEIAAMGSYINQNKKLVKEKTH